MQKLIIMQDVHHVAIICSDYERSKDFYVRILAFEVIREVYREQRQSYKLDLKVSATCFIELFSFPNSPSRPSYPEACGLRHLAFRVLDIDEATQYLTSQLIQVEHIRIDQHTGKRYTFFHDPDGLPLELYEE